MARLHECEPSYIRCIKSNDQKQAGQFDAQRVRHQVRYLGLLENVRVRRAGFAFRQTFERFAQRYKLPGGSSVAIEHSDTAFRARNVRLWV